MKKPREEPGSCGHECQIDIQDVKTFIHNQQGEIKTAMAVEDKHFNASRFNIN